VHELFLLLFVFSLALNHLSHPSRHNQLDQVMCPGPLYHRLHLHLFIVRNFILAYQAAAKLVIEVFHLHCENKLVDYSSVARY